MITVIYYVFYMQLAFVQALFLRKHFLLKDNHLVTEV